jgi:hypothetical protein
VLAASWSSPRECRWAAKSLVALAASVRTCTGCARARRPAPTGPAAGPGGVEHREVRVHRAEHPGWVQRPSPCVTGAGPSTGRA